MKKTLFTCLALSLLFLVTVDVARAENVVRSGNEVSISEDQIINGDFYSAGGKVSISGEIKEDALIVGGQVTVNGPVGSDVFIFGGRVDVHSTIGDDLRVVAGEVTIAEPIMGDVFISARTVSILSTASVSGDIILLAENVSIEGSVGGDIIGTVSNLKIDAVVEGDIDVKVGQISLGDRAEVLGSVRYVSTQLITQALNSSVEGDLVRSDPVIPVKDATLRTVLTPLLILLFSVLIWYLISRSTLNKISKRALVVSPRPALLGLVTLFFAPLGIAILLISVIGTFVGVVALFTYALLVLLSFIGMSAVIGLMLMRVFNQPNAHLSLLSLVVGVIGVSLLSLLPVLGQLIILLFIIITLGAMVDLLIRPSVK